MSQVQSGSEAAAAALVGSLANFSLIDVLDLLARTGHTGELQVVGRGIDRHVWVDQGDLVDATGTGGLQAVLFELACRDEGWFYFSCTTGVPDGAERLTVSDVIGDLGPQVEEWRGLNEALPFDATVAMSTSSPSDDVQIKGSQWHLLTAIGSGRSVRDVVDGESGHPLDTLRTLRELTDAGLIDVHLSPVVEPEPLPETLPDPPAPPAPPAPEADASTDEAPAWNAPSMPMPEGESDRVRDPNDPPLPPFVRPGSDGSADAPPAPEGYISATDDVVDPDAVMPPPVSGDPWSSSLAAEESTSS